MGQKTPTLHFGLISSLILAALTVLCQPALCTPVNKAYGLNAQRLSVRLPRIQYNSMGRAVSNPTSRYTTSDHITYHIRPVKRGNEDVDMDYSDDFDEEDNGSSSGEEPREEFTEETYNDLITKGHRNYGWMNTLDVKKLTETMRKDKVIPSNADSQSRFNDYSKDFASNGWPKNSGWDLKEIVFDRDIRLGTSFKSLGLSASYPDKNIAVSWTQNQKEFNGKTHKMATEGDYLNLFNPSDGVLICHSANSPSHHLRSALRREGHSASEIAKLLDSGDYPIPSLHSLSDVQFLEYANQAKMHQNQNPNKLRYIFHHDVRTPATVDLLDHIFHLKGYRPSQGLYEFGVYRALPWKDRLTFMDKDEEFNALLASAQGNNVVFLLVQHRQVLGEKRVKRIYIFRDDAAVGKEYTGATILFELEDVDGGGSAKVGGGGES